MGLEIQVCISQCEDVERLCSGLVVSLVSFLDPGSQESRLGSKMDVLLWIIKRMSFEDPWFNKELKTLVSGG